MPNQILEYFIKFTVMPLLSLFCGSSINRFHGNVEFKGDSRGQPSGELPWARRRPCGGLSAVTAPWGQRSSSVSCGVCQWMHPAGMLLTRAQFVTVSNPRFIQVFLAAPYKFLGSPGSRFQFQDHFPSCTYLMCCHICKSHHSFCSLLLVLNANTE